MINLDDIKQMLAEADEHTLTLYLHVDNALEENQATQPAWKIWLKDTLRSLRDQDRKGSDSAKGVWDKVQEQLDEYLTGYQPGSKGLVLFVTPASVRSVELPLSFDNQAFFGKPAVAPLLWELDEHEPYLISLIDQEKARFFVAQLGAVKFEEAIEIDLDSYDFREKTLMPSTSAVTGGHELTQGSNREAFQDMLNEHRNRFYRETAQLVAKLAEQNGARRIILGGAEESAHAVKNMLPETTVKQVMDIVPIPMRSTLQQISEQAQERALAFERAEEFDLVNQVIDLAKSGGRGALGHKAVMEALEMQRVELLILPWPMDDENLAAELPLRAFSSGGSVELVHGAAADRLKEEGGIAARLYYTL